MKRVDYTTSVKLKEAGYDVPTRHYYLDHISKGVMEDYSEEESNYNGSYKWHTSMPTLAEVTDWLRTKELHCCPQPNINYLPNKWIWELFVLKGQNWELSDCRGPFDNHDSALSAAITHALQLLTTKI